MSYNPPGFDWDRWIDDRDRYRQGRDEYLEHVCCTAVDRAREQTDLKYDVQLRNPHGAQDVRLYDDVVQKKRARPRKKLLRRMQSWFRRLYTNV